MRKKEGEVPMRGLRSSHAGGKLSVAAVFSCAAFLLLLGLLWPLASGLFHSGHAGLEAAFAAPAPYGTIVFVRDGNLWKYDFDGAKETLLVEDGTCQSPDLHPTGRKVVYTSMRDGLTWSEAEGIKRQIYEYDMATGKSRRLVYDPGCDMYGPSYSPDGRMLVFARAVNPHVDSGFGSMVIFDAELCVMDLGSGSVRVIDRDEEGNGWEWWTYIEPTFLPGGKKIVYVESGEGVSAAGVIPASGGETQWLDFSVEVGEDYPNVYGAAYSPDGKKMAASAGIPSAVFLRSPVDSLGKKILSGDDVGTPRSFSPDSAFIAYDGYSHQDRFSSVYVSNLDGSYVRKLITKAESPDWGIDYRSDWRRDLKRGDILLHRSSGALSRLVFFTHAGIYVGNGKVVEARDPVMVFPFDDGIGEYDVSDWDYPRDTYVSVMRLKGYKENAEVRAKAEAAADWALNQARRSYTAYQEFYLWLDRWASASSPGWYCSELVWASYWNQGVDLAVRGGMGPSFSTIAVSPDYLYSDDDVQEVASHHEFCPGHEELGMSVRADCPVDLALEDPEGREFSPDTWEIEGTYYLQTDVDGNGEVEDVIALPSRMLGDYRVKVTPEEGASNADTFSLQASIKGTVYELAEDMRIADIPAEGFLISAPEKTWYLAEGCTEGGFETWVLVQNPGSEAAHLKLTFMTETGPRPGPEVDLPGGSRTSFNVGESVTTWKVSTLVESDRPVVAERAMYGAGRTWGHDSCGYAP